MRYIIRKSVLVSFIFLTAFSLACSVSTAEKHTDANINKPLALPKTTSNRPKIIAFGDSLTAGFGLSEPESYPYLLQQRLAADGYDYEVVNAGVSGDTTLGGLERIDWVLDTDNAK